MIPTLAHGMITNCSKIKERFSFLDESIEVYRLLKPKYWSFVYVNVQVNSRCIFKLKLIFDFTLNSVRP